MDSSRFSKSFFSTNTDLSSFFKVSVFSYLLLLHNSNITFYFSCFQWNSEWPEFDRKCCWSWHASRINLLFLRLYFLHFSFNASIDSFLHETDGSFLKIMKFVFVHRTWSPDWPNVAKVLLLLNYLDVPNRASRKQHFCIRLSRSRLRVASFRRFLRWNNFWLCPLNWNVDKLNKQKGSNNVVSMSFFKQ